MVGPRLLGRLYCGVTTTGHPHLYGGVEELWLKGFGFGLSGFRCLQCGLSGLLLLCLQARGHRTLCLPRSVSVSLCLSFWNFSVATPSRSVSTCICGGGEAANPLYNHEALRKSRPLELQSMNPA